MGRQTSPMSETSRTPTPTMSISEELKEKRERMMKKLRMSDEEKIDEKFDVGEKKKEKRKQRKESSPRKQKTQSVNHSKGHKGCHSSCQKDHRWSDDDKWLVPDSYESSEEETMSSDDLLSDEDKRRVKKKHRKKTAGGDVLFWMNPGHKCKTHVKVQMFAKEDIVDMNYYKMKLLADDGSDTELESTPGKKTSGSSEEDI